MANILTSLYIRQTPCVLLVAGGVTLVVAFHFLPQRFGKVVGTYE